jgi:DNA-binding transcriptional ArsR family regulator
VWDRFPETPISLRSRRCWLTRAGPGCFSLGDGRALAATTLAAEAGVAVSTASAHLAKLVQAELLQVERHGRHRYYRLTGPDVGELLEALARLAPAAPVRSLREGSRAHAVGQNVL